MAQPMLHHASIVTRDLPRSLAFYRDVIGLPEIDRPPLRSKGAWLAVGDAQLHLILNPEGCFRDGRPIDTSDVHFALRVDNFEDMVSRLAANGFVETSDTTDARRMIVKRAATAGFPQVFFLDPDRNIVEINAAPIAGY